LKLKLGYVRSDMIAEFTEENNYTFLEFNLVYLQNNCKQLKYIVLNI